MWQGQAKVLHDSTELCMNLAGLVDCFLVVFQGEGTLVSSIDEPLMVTQLLCRVLPYIPRQEFAVDL
jgi:hypothetical protein